jgi:hypothetical protein
MTLKEKINVFLKSKGLGQPELATMLELNYQRMNKNIAAGKLTIDVAMGLAQLFPDLDMNWLMRDSNSVEMIREPEISYGEDPKDLLGEMRRLCDKLEQTMTRE